jgi:two-component system, OmpR family, alkaline phosphatase synthesis response regulator PhoP
MNTQRRILLVDDEPHILRLAELSLRKGGFVLNTARNGAEALKCVDAEIPDLIIMDVQMPEMDGLQALHHLKQKPATASIPVIMLTARGHQLTRQEAESIGASAFLTKPFSPTQLLAESRRILGV